MMVRIDTSVYDGDFTRCSYSLYFTMMYKDWGLPITQKLMQRSNVSNDCSQLNCCVNRHNCMVGSTHQTLCILCACVMQDWGISMYQRLDRLQKLFCMLDFGMLAILISINVFQQWEDAVQGSTAVKVGANPQLAVRQRNNWILHDKFQSKWWCQKTPVQAEDMHGAKTQVKAAAWFLECFSVRAMATIVCVWHGCYVDSWWIYKPLWTYMHKVQVMVNPVSWCSRWTNMNGLGLGPWLYQQEAAASSHHTFHIVLW